MSTIEEIKAAQIKTYTGKLVSPLAMSLEDIHQRDIVHALSNKCRFTGHTRSFYSVGSHSCVVYEILKEILEKVVLENSSKIDLLNQSMLHDSDEAYLPDIPSPLKRLDQFAFMREAGKHIFSLVMQYHGLPLEEDPLVKQADRLALFFEKRVYMNAPMLNESELIEKFNLKEDFPFEKILHLVKRKPTLSSYYTSYIGSLNDNKIK
jgi:5'-deoxynucleotidase YfbR-like HD superfamily hydrolase